MTADRSSESERRTRKSRVDPRLRAWGWEIAPFELGRSLAKYRRHAIEEYPTANGPADYALVVDGQLLGVVEAKKVTLGPQNVLTQAERYSQGIDGTAFNFNGYRAPFLYSTNGEVFWFQDVRHKLNRSRKVSGFHTPEALREMLARDADSETEWFRQNPNQHPRLRPYQIEACTAIEDAIAKRTRAEFAYVRAGFFPDAANAYKQELENLGQPTRIQLLQREELGDDHIYLYQLTFAGATRYARLGLAPDDRVSAFWLRDRPFSPTALATASCWSSAETCRMGSG